MKNLHSIGSQLTTTYILFMLSGVLLIVTGISIIVANTIPYDDFVHYLIFCGSGILVTSIMGLIGGLRGSSFSVCMHSVFLLVVQGSEMLFVVIVLFRRVNENLYEALNYCIMTDPAFWITAAVVSVLIMQFYAQFALVKLSLMLKDIEDQKRHSVEQRNASSGNQLLAPAPRYSKTPSIV